MRTFRLNRPCIYEAPAGLSVDEWKSYVPDSALRRHLSWSMDFDLRANGLKPIPDHWEERVKAQHQASQEQIKQGLVFEFGTSAKEDKLKNFLAIGVKPMSIVSYHNTLFDQIRNAFVMGYYYPALVGACTLGERMLNHLVLDMRPFFRSTPEYKKVHRKNSFDNWDVPINALCAWEILLPEVVIQFQKLKSLRHRSVHFNANTYDTLREDALTAISHLGSIMEIQFGTFAKRPWFISGTKGQVFIRKSYEDHPFVKTYFIPLCPFVGPLFGIRSKKDGGWEVWDVPDYGEGSYADSEFASLYNNRNPDDVVAEPPKIERNY